VTLKELQTARGDHAPYSEERLAELVSIPPALRHAEPSREAGAGPTRADGRDAPDLPQALEERLAERDAGPGFSKRDPALENADRAANDIAGSGERVAGGIAKVAEVLADAISSFINPPSPREQAVEKALDAAREAREAERQPLREQQQREQHMVLHENQRTASDPFETYLNENAERIRREWERRWHERKAREPDDSSRDR
jgi:hypothetical protein